MKHNPLFSPLAFIAVLLVASATVCTTASAQIVTSNLQLWLTSGTGVSTDGSGNVSTWADQSGNGNNATQGTSGARPAYVTSGADTTPTGLASVSFDGINDNLLGTMGTLTYTDIFIVGRLNSANTAANEGVMAITNGTDLDFNGSNSALVWATGYNAGAPTGEDARWAAGAPSSLINGTLALNNWYVYEYRVENVAGNVNLSIYYRGLSDSNFVLLGSGNIAVGSTINATEYNLGSRLFPTPNYFSDVDIASVLVYNGALNTSDQTQVRDTLYNTYLVPEPQTWALAALGAAAVLFRLRRHRQSC